MESSTVTVYRSLFGPVSEALLTYFRFTQNHHGKFDNIGFSIDIAILLTDSNKNHAWPSNKDTAANIALARNLKSVQYLPAAADEGATVTSPHPYLNQGHRQPASILVPDLHDPARCHSWLVYDRWCGADGEGSVCVCTTHNEIDTAQTVGLYLCSFGLPLPVLAAIQLDLDQLERASTVIVWTGSDVQLSTRSGWLQSFYGVD
ncbi:hypothetical protein EDB86DRAFT_2829058 [Lactarius hatsudake]|nr:hypothetical protein EDB86DRAFT_2829058 [Lactarius hatsudake]